jgi:DNA mismatch repair ATPase MutS
MYHAGNYTCFADGSEYIDPKHPFTFDMDIFGPQSLYQRINRTVTKGGADKLAEDLSTLNGDKQNIDNRAETIHKLAKMEKWRTEFMAQGQRAVIDTDSIISAINDVKAMRLSAYPLSILSLVVALLLIVAFAAVVVLSFMGMIPPSVSVTWGTLQLLLVMMVFNKALKQIGKAVNKLHGQMRQYVSLIRLISENEIITTDCSFSQDGQGEAPLIAFNELRRILSGLDRRGNVLALMITDMFLLSDYFLVRRFLRWQSQYIDRVEEWINNVSDVDALVSMATFAYNEPLAVRAVIVNSKEVVYEATGLYHPFIGDKAVRNDFSIVNNNYYIITGANMAGKSTFLRSLGINYILARNGMPVFADSLRVSIYNLFTSMRTSDDLSGGISYFNAELLRLKQLVSLVACPDTTPSEGKGEVLIILDEILKGTNSLDKLNGSRMFLEAMATQSVSGIIATHDLELSKMSDERPDRFHNYCFEIELSNDITYNYKITPGVARNQNATYLLRGVLSDLGV